jgi:hypothetical protein
VVDAHENAAAETVMGLFKNEAVAKDSPFRAGAPKTETDVVNIVFERSTGTTTNASIPPWSPNRRGI